MSHPETEVRACRNCAASVAPEDERCYACGRSRDWSPSACSLLACPFCGCEAVLVESLTIKVVGCRDCKARIGSSIDRKQTPGQLIDAWNLRANDQEQESEL